MDRDTIKNLLMTTSVVAIIAGSAQEANATVVCASTAVFTTPQASVTQTTNVACILIESTTVTGDVTVNPGVTIGPNGLAAEITIFDSSIGGGFFNNGTVLGTVAGGGALEINAGLVIEGGSTVGNGVTNGATGVFSIQAISTAISGTAQADAVGVEITQSSFAGNLVN